MSLLLLLALGACSREARRLGAGPPITPPRGPADARIPYYQGNVYRIAQGGRYFAWYGCSGCHNAAAHGALKLSDGVWRRGGGFGRLYRTIAAHGQGPRIPGEQLWEITAYVRDMPSHTPAKLRRQNLDQKGEPTGATWSGPVR